MLLFNEAFEQQRVKVQAKISSIYQSNHQFTMQKILQYDYRNRSVKFNNSTLFTAIAMHNCYININIQLFLHDSFIFVLGISVLQSPQQYNSNSHWRLWSVLMIHPYKKQVRKLLLQQRRTITKSEIQLLFCISTFFL